jgi:glycoprotein-N-acetylgalactosamine 3-beta-galactosyltransferase
MIAKKLLLLLNFMFLFVILNVIVFGLHKTTKSDTSESLSLIKNLNSSREGDEPRRIFCFILTQPKNINTRAHAVYKAWAHKCDNFKFVLKFPSNLTNNNEFLKFAHFNYQSNGQETLDINNIIEPGDLNKDEYRNLATKVFLNLRYVYEKYDYYDWYLKADDDTFVFVDNMRLFLADKDPKQPVTYGYNFKVIVENGYHSGGGGYLLSNEALKRLGSRLTANLSNCQNTGTEDVDVGRCLRKLNVSMGESIDEKGRERFHPLSFFFSIFTFFGQKSKIFKYLYLIR